MKKVLRIVLLFLTFFLLANLVISLVLIGMGLDEVADDAFASFIFYVGSFVMTIGLMSIFKKSLGIHLPSLKPEVHRLNLPLILLGFIAIQALNIVVEPLLELMPDSNLDGLYDMMNGGLWSIMMTVVAAPILEEYLFRGVLQRSFFNAISRPIVSILLSAAIFGLIHIIPQQMIFAFLAGLVLGTIFQITHSLTTVVIIHMLTNGLAYSQFTFFGRDSNLFSLIFSSPTSYAILYTGSFVICIGLGVWAFRLLVRRRI